MALNPLAGPDGYDPADKRQCMAFAPLVKPDGYDPAVKRPGMALYRARVVSCRGGRGRTGTWGMQCLHTPYGLDHYRHGTAAQLILTFPFAVIRGRRRRVTCGRDPGANAAAAVESLHLPFPAATAAGDRLRRRAPGRIVFGSWLPASRSGSAWRIPPPSPPAEAAAVAGFRGRTAGTVPGIPKPRQAGGSYRRGQFRIRAPLKTLLKIGGRWISKLPACTGFGRLESPLSPPPPPSFQTVGGFRSLHGQDRRFKAGFYTQRPAVTYQRVIPFTLR